MNFDILYRRIPKIWGRISNSIKIKVIFILISIGNVIVVINCVSHIVVGISSEISIITNATVSIKLI